MARLVVKSQGFCDQVIELHLGVNRLGRSPENHFQIQHPSISASHCEVILAADEVTVRDCDSTNGTFIGGEKVTGAELRPGQNLLRGEAALLIGTAAASGPIRPLYVPRPAPSDGFTS